MFDRFLNLPLLPWALTRWVIGKYMLIRDRHFSWEGRYVLLAGLFVALMALDVQGTRVYVIWSIFFGAFFVSLHAKMFYKFPLRVERDIPRVASVESPLNYRVKVTNLSDQPLHELHIREEALPRFVKHVHERGIVSLIDVLEPGETVNARISLNFERRGVFTLPAPRAERFCPLGIMRSGKSFPANGQVVVFPTWYPIESVNMSAANVHQPGGVPLASTVGESLETIGLREYRPGDQVKNISWKAWARLGEPAVREFQSEYFKRVALIMDTHVDEPERRRDDFEAAVSACASLARHFDEHEYIIDLFAAGQELYYMQAGRGLAGLDAILEVLALVEPIRGEPFPKIDTPLRDLLSRLSGLILVTSDWQERHEKFYRSIEAHVPQFKPVVVRKGAPTKDPTKAVNNPEIVAVINAEKLAEELIIL